MSGIIKVEPISTSHAHNAIEYSMQKLNNKNEKEKPELLRLNHIDMGDITFSDPTPKDVWNLMKLHQAKYKFKRNEMFVRVELSPPMDKCRNWNNEQWQKWLDGCLRHLDDKKNYYRKKLIKEKNGSPKLDKNGNKLYRVIGKPFRFQDCQYVASIHRDTDHWHVHLIANRVTMDGECMDMHKCHERAIKASDNYADELGWKHTSDYENKRKARIYKDAIDILKNMKSFNLDDYFKGMRDKGYVVNPNTPDSHGVIHGYSIGEYVHPEDNTPLMYRASKLGYGDALTIKNLQRTWTKVHDIGERRQTSLDKKKPEEMKNPLMGETKKRRWDKQREPEKPKEPTVQYENEGKPFDIPKSVDSFMRDIITLPSSSDYEDEVMDGKNYEPDIPTLDEVAETAAAMFVGVMEIPLGLIDATMNVTPSAGGGGGGGGGGRDDDDEWKNKARRAAMAAGLMHTPKHGSKKSRGRHS